MKQMPIFSKSFDLLAYLINLTNHFPKAQRHQLTHRILSTAFDFREYIEEANLSRNQARKDKLITPSQYDFIFYNNGLQSLSNVFL